MHNHQTALSNPQIPIKCTHTVEQDPQGRILDIAVWYFPYRTEYSILNLTQLNEQTNGLIQRD